ncbi:hypothetical protein E1B28_007531 [Marasmius oreades]|uniref:Secreted protein n=1 Tax=Marasmius oreades TaxID=181124 RepID=A0A9P7S2J9_9AGAR|nr:uncharacterized protein E1B28_007531 [Marasmius oreades]KAG7093892.1 hypothetical protein E1B28_007531 [Marasmius oreades]
MISYSHPFVYISFRGFFLLLFSPQYLLSAVQGSPWHKARDLESTLTSSDHSAAPAPSPHLPTTHVCRTVYVFTSGFTVILTPSPQIMISFTRRFAFIHSNTNLRRFVGSWRLGLA